MVTKPPEELARRRRTGRSVLPILLLFVPALGIAPRLGGETAGGAPPLPLLSGAVARGGSIDPALLRELPPRRLLTHALNRDGSYAQAIEVEGIGLGALLDRVEIKKVPDGFDRPLDTFVVVTGRQGELALFSWGELFATADGGPLLVERARFLLPHHHEPFEKAPFDVKAFLDGAARDALDLTPCASCHDGKEQRAIALPRGFLLVTPGDPFPGRFVAEVAEIRVAQVGIEAPPRDKDADKKSLPPLLLVGPNGSGKLDGRTAAKVPRRSFSGAAWGMGRGFKGEHRWEGLDLGDLMRSRIPKGVSPSDTWVLVTAADGYRSLYSGREVFSSKRDGGVLLVDREDGKPLREGLGKYRTLPAGDFFVDRSVRLVSEIRLGVAPTGPAPRPKP